MILYQTAPRCYLTSQRPKKQFTNTRCAPLSVVGTCGSEVIDNYKFIILSCFLRCALRFSHASSRLFWRHM